MQNINETASLNVNGWWDLVDNDILYNHPQREGTMSFGVEELLTLPAQSRVEFLPDTVFSNPSSSLVSGSEIWVNKKIEGTSNNDTLKGGDGNDTLLGFNGQDKLFGGSGDDSLNGGDGDDKLLGQEGNDILVGGSGQDKLKGGLGDDSLDGGDGDDKLLGHEGSDALFGGQGQDQINGGAGNDFLNGGSGDNTLTGGADSDTFVVSRAGKNRITDFEDGVDLLVLEGGLTFDQIRIFEQNCETWITTLDNQPLAFLTGVKPNQITEADFLNARDLAGNTPTEALRTRPPSFGTTIREYVDSADPVDYYSFILGARNQFNLSLDGLAANANVEVLDFNNNIIASSTNPGRTAELIGTALTTGVYRVRVTSADTVGTPYNLNLSINPLIDGLTTTGSERLEELHTNASGPLINLDDFRSGNPALGSDPRFTGIDGTGSSVVIIDTGINLNHPFFGPDADGNGVADRIVFHMDFTNPNGADIDGDGIPDGADTNGHGTNVSSIAASQDRTFGGMAPGANIIHLKVFPDVANPTATVGDVEQALQWVAENAARFNIASVNLSLGSGNFNSPQSDSRGDEFQLLSDLGVITVASSGNNFFNLGSTQGVAAPSADPNVLSIGAVFDANVGNFTFDANGDGTAETVANTTNADRIAPFSQRSQTLTTVFAPGAQITGAGLNDTRGNPNFTSTWSGTSQAAPHVAGIAALAQQLAVQELGRRLTPAEFRSLVASTGVTIFDGDNEGDGVIDADDEDDNVTNTGLNFQRVDMLALGQAIPDLQTVTVTINRVTGDFDPIFNDSDFYSLVSIAGDENRSGTVTGNNIRPNWQFTRGVTGSSVPITIKIYDDDGFLTFDNEHVDINPNSGSKDLSLSFDLVTGRITDSATGQFYGLRGQQITLIGDGDDDEGGITFTVDGFGVSNPTPPPVNVAIHRIKGDFDGLLDDSDFYTNVSIAGVEQRSNTFEGNSDLRPELTFSQNTTARFVPITLSVFDEDGFLAGDDDHIDINPNSGSKDLNLIYDQVTGTIVDSVTGQQLGTRGRLINLQGSGDDDQGEIWFSVYGSPSTLIV